MALKPVIKMLLTAVTLVLLFAIGVFISLYFSSADQTVLREKLGFYKTQVIGFQPYWLVNSGKDSYAGDVTTLTYFGLAVSPDGTIRKYDRPGEWEPGWAMLSKESYKQKLSDMKKQGVRLSLLVANMDEGQIGELLKKPEQSAVNLVESVEPVMRNNGFTDLNLDIESFQIASDSTRASYVSFVSEVKKQVNGKKLGTVTVELTPKSPVESHFMDVGKIGQIADFVVLMAYDYHYSLSDKSGPVAPLTGAPHEREYDVKTALEQTLRYVPREKVILGIPTYGYEWETLSDVPGSPTISRSWSVVSQKRAVNLMAGCASCSANFDPVAQAPFAVYPGEFDNNPMNPLGFKLEASASGFTPNNPEIGYNHMHQLSYEDERSIQAKLDLADKYKIAGVAFWALGYEDPADFEIVKGYRRKIILTEFTPEYDFPVFSITAPGLALTGLITEKSGNLKKLERNASGFKEVGVRDILIQGETVFADKESAAEIVFDPVVKISLGADTEIDFPELIPPSAVAKQKTGSAQYTLMADTPWSVRIFHVLLTLRSGSVRVKVVDDAKAEIFQAEGESLLGYIDSANTTFVKKLDSGGTASVNYETRRVILK